MDYIQLFDHGIEKKQAVFAGKFSIQSNLTATKPNLIETVIEHCHMMNCFLNIDFKLFFLFTWVCVI